MKEYRVEEDVKIDNILIGSYEIDIIIPKGTIIKLSEVEVGE